MADNRSTLSATVTAKDEASPTLMQVAKTMQELDAKSRIAGDGFSDFSSKASSANDIFMKMPERLSKGASAFSVLGGAAASAGGSLGASISKVSQLGALVSGGGAVGIGIAAVTVAVAAGKAAWDAYSAEAKAVSGIIPSLSGTFKMLGEDLKKSREDVEKLTNEIVWFGKTAKEQTIGTLTEQTAAQEKAIDSNERMIASIRESAAQYRKQAEIAFVSNEAGAGDRMLAEAKAADAQAEALAKGNAIARDSVIENYNRITLLETLIEKEAEAKKSTENKARSDRDATEAAREAAQAAEETAKQELDFEVALRKTIDTMREGALKSELDRIDALSKKRRTSIDAHADQFEKYAKDLDKQDDKLTRDRIQNAERVASAISGPLANALGDILTREKTVAEAGKQMFATLARTAINAALQYAIGEGIKQIASKITAGVAVAADATAAGADVASTNVQISAASARGAAEAIAAFAGVPVVGPALGAAQAGVVTGMIESTRGLMAMAEGGVVTGGIPGVDSVHIMAQQGERMLSVKQTSIFDRFVTALERNNGTVGGGGRNIIVKQEFHQAFSPTSAESKRQARDVAKVMRRLR